MNYLTKGLRYSDRKLDEYRQVSVELNVTKNAEGSARVKLGDTEVIAGVKMELGKPFPDKPDEGSIMVNAELLPLSNPEFESGPPGVQAVELARVVDRGIRESKAIDFKKLCVEPGEKIWLVIIDIISINDAGNLLDAAALAAMAAIQDAHFPKIVDDKVDYYQKTKEKVELAKVPVSVTVYKVEDKFLIDPDYEEEKFVDGRSSLDDGTLCAMQKGLDSPLTIEQIDKMVELALTKAKELRKHLN